jgi:DNA-binding transcriptional regulator LsrR (DeoR family)
MSDMGSTELLEEIKSVKMLLILQLLSIGVKQKQIAMMLGISEATMSRLVPKGLAIGKPQAGGIDRA